MDKIQEFHLVIRCVRRPLLCNEDVATGKDYSHRKEWIRNRLEELAGIFALDEMSFSVLSNHLHVVVRTRPDVVKHGPMKRWLSAGGDCFLNAVMETARLRNRWK